MRKKLIIAALAALVVSLMAYGTLAYMTAETTAHNIITAGSVDIVLYDKSRPEGDDGQTPIEQLPDFPAQGLRVMPGTEASKLVAVAKASSSADCWVRVKLTPTLTLADGTSRTMTADDPITLVLNSTDWLAGEDGWFYLQRPLTGDEPLSELLLSAVRFEPGMGNQYQGSTLSIDVSAQAVQSKNNDIPQKSAENPNPTVEDVGGWPQD